MTKKNTMEEEGMMEDDYKEGTCANCGEKLSKCKCGE